MDSNPRTRRAALKKIGLGSTALLAGVSGISSVGAAKNEQADFDPYNLSEVGDFAEEYVVKKRIEKPGDEPDEVRFNQSVDGLDQLSDRQVDALIDGISPKITQSVSIGSDSSTSSSIASTDDNSSVDVIAPEENPVEKWDWKVPNEITEGNQLKTAAANSETSDISPSAVASSAPETFSNVQQQRALSIDYTAWRWKCVIKWRHNSSRITRSKSYDNVLYTNYAINYKGTNKNVTDMRRNIYAVVFHAKFHNKNAQICVPGTGICYDSSQNFRPSQKLKGNANGRGTLVFNRKDTLLG